MKLPEQFIEEYRQLTGETDRSKFICAHKIGKGWDDYGEKITMTMADEQGWDEPNYKKAYTWFIESVAGSVKSNVNEIYTHSRIYKNVLKPELDIEHNAFTYCQWDSLLRNIKKSKGIVDADIFAERIEWMYSEAEKHYGEFPSTRNINAEYKRNGYKKEWEVLWGKLVKLAKQLRKLDETPNLLRGALHEIEKVELD